MQNDIGNFANLVYTTSHLAISPVIHPGREGPFIKPTLSYSNEKSA